MKVENQIQEIEPEMVVVGGAYAATILGLIFWLAL